MEPKGIDKSAGSRFGQTQSARRAETRDGFSQPLTVLLKMNRVFQLCLVDAGDEGVREIGGAEVHVGRVFHNNIP